MSRTDGRPTAPIRSWNDGYVALRQRAGEVRGWIELDSDAWDRRWPRSTGLDVVVIAAFLDAAFQRTDTGRWMGTALRWTDCLGEIERDALGALGSTYPGNRAFWPCVGMLCAHLAYVGAPLPTPAAWRAVLAQIGDGAITRRNAAPDRDEPPVWFVDAGTLDKLYQRQRQYLAEQRGADRLVPEPGMAGGAMPVPRTTVADVRQLARFWTPLLDHEKAKNANGYETVAARWRTALRGLDPAADPSAIYPHNHEFWRAASAVSIHVAASLAYGLTDADVRRAAIGARLEPMQGAVRSLAEAIASGVQSAATGAGRAVNAAARGLFSGAAAPLLLGGGAVAAIWLLRGRSTRAGGRS